MLVAFESSMSSREIAELVELRHDNVKRTMDTLLDRGLITFTQIEEKSTGGRPAEVYMVNKRDSYVVVAQLSPEFTARLVDRWQELESQATMTPTQLILLQAQALVEQEARISQTECAVSQLAQRLDQIETSQEHFTIIGWGKMKKKSIPDSAASAMGRQASNYCRLHDVEMGQTPHPRFGTVYTYPAWVLDQLFEAA